MSSVPASVKRTALGNKDVYVERQYQGTFDENGLKILNEDKRMMSISEFVKQAGWPFSEAANKILERSTGQSILDKLKYNTKSSEKNFSAYGKPVKKLYLGSVGVIVKSREKISGKINKDGTKIIHKGKELTPTIFAKLAKVTARKDIYKRIILMEEERSIFDHVQNKEPMGEQMQKLRDKLGGMTIRSLHNKHLTRHGTKKARIVYRVCRIANQRKIRESGNITPREPRDFNWDDRNATFDYFRQMNKHIRSTANTPFVSATSEPETFAWWSMFGIIPGIKIKVGFDPNCNTWDFNDAELRTQVLLPSLYNSFAKHSHEVIFDKAIPSTLYKEVQCERRVLGGAPIAQFKRSNNLQFPNHLNPNSLSVEILKGSTQPIKVTINGCNFVMKRGGRTAYKQNDGIKFPCNQNQMAAEFFGNLVYHKAGIKVPSSALYSIEFKMDNIELHATVLLTEFIHGTNVADRKTPPMQVKSEIKDGFLVDCILQNEDVVGPKYSNLIQESGVQYSVFRIDNGGILDFNPGGSKRDFDKSPSMEDMIRKMKYGQRKDAHTENESNSQIQTRKRKGGFADPTESAHLCRVACYEAVTDRTVEKQLDKLKKSNFLNEIGRTRFQGTEISFLICPQFANYFNILKARMQEVLNLCKNGDLWKIFSKRKTQNPSSTQIQITQMYRSQFNYDDSDSDDFQNTEPRRKRSKLSVRRAIIE